MTTKAGVLPYRILSDIDYDSLEFNPFELDSGPDYMFQFPTITEIAYVLDAHLNSLYPPDEVFRNGNTFICYDPANRNVRISPDWYVAFGVDALAIMRRSLYLPDEVGKPPDLVLEVASESTAKNDLEEKPFIYAPIGVPEYWRVDPTGGDYYGYPLAGDRLVNGVYQPIELTAEPDGVPKLYSQVLGLSFSWQDGQLKFYHRETGTYLLTYREQQAAQQAAEAAQRAAETARQAAETDLRSAHSRIRQLEEELRNRQG